MSTNLIILLCLLSSFKFTHQVAISKDLSRSNRRFSSEAKYIQEIEDDGRWLLPALPHKMDRTDILQESSGKFLNSIYSYIVEELPEDGFIPETLDMHDIEKLEKSNMLMTFYPKIFHDNQRLHKLYNRINRLWFDVTKKLITNDRIIAAELRIYRNSSLAKIRGPKISISFNCTDLNNRKTSINHDNTVVVDDDFSGWIRFNMTDCFKYWTKYPQDNEGILLTATAVNYNKKNSRINFKDLGIPKFSRNPATRTFLIGYFNDNSKNNFYTDMQQQNLLPIYGNNDNDNNGADGKNNPGCQLRSEFVDLDQRNKFWVIAPRKYYASYCAGNCEYLRYQNYNGYNYMWRNNYQGSTESCRPRRWEGKPFFYYINGYNYVLKYIYDRVASCGCQ